jgi:hydroxypyruvate isomerase
VIWSAHLSALFRELPYLERPRAAAEAGFTCVETWWPEDDLGEAWADETVRLGLDVALVNCFGGDLDAGERGFLNVPDRHAEAIDAFRAAVALAGRCGAQTINVLGGRERAGEGRTDQLARAASVLAECAELAGELTIVVESINELDVPGSLVPTPAAAADLVEATGSPRVRLLYDAYHAARAGGDPVREVAAFGPLLGHVQYADCPGRGAPGTGGVDLRSFAAAVEGTGYDGPIGLEFFTDQATADALGFMAA